MSSGLDRSAMAPGIGESFDTVVVPHLDAAYRLARWLMRDGHDAEDVVQEASLRAFRYFRTFVGGDGRAWFLRIVRHTCYGWRRHGCEPATDLFDEERHSGTRTPPDPEMLLLQTDDAMSIARALSSLPDHFHQLLVLRELQGLSYRELSEVIGIPMGTVMSRLSRARDALRTALDARLPPPGTSPGTDAREQEADAVVVRTGWTRKAREARVEASAFRSAAVAPASHAGRTE
jgi:RNA polymerase sigma-70 factor, ECF subfamily